MFSHAMAVIHCYFGGWVIRISELIEYFGWDNITQYFLLK